MAADAGQINAPVLRCLIVKRAEAGGGVMVDHLCAGQPEHQIAGRGQHGCGFCPDIGVIAREPQDFRPHRLRGQRVAAAGKDRCRADPGIQFGNLGAGTGIDAVKHGVHQGRAGLVNGQHAGADGRCGDGADGFGINAAFGQQPPCEPDEIAPPILFGAVFRPARPGHDHLVGTFRLCGDPAVIIHQNAFRIERSDVDPKGISNAHQSGLAASCTGYISAPFLIIGSVTATLSILTC